MGKIFWSGLFGVTVSTIRAKHYLEVSCVEHDNPESYGLFGLVLLDLCIEQYDGFPIPGHNSIPKTLYWLRKAAALPDAKDFYIKECKRLESYVNSRCANCKKNQDELHETLKACSLCKAAYYCGKECQTEHWKLGHKVDCIRRNYPPKRAGN